MKIFKRLLASFLVVVMFITAAPLAALVGLDFGLKAEAVAIHYKTGDVITFGAYPQTKVSNSDLVKKLAEQDCDSKGFIYYDNQSYMMIGSNYYLYEPITWRILSVDKDGIYIMAEKILDSQPYYTSASNIIWAESTLRTWLNTEFYDLAFSFS